MKKILIATTNPGKVMTIKKILAKFGYEGLSIADLDLKLEEPEETKLTAEEIAAEKAEAYAKQYADLPVLARDDTTLLVGVDEEDDPKNHGKAFIARRMGEYTDENGKKLFSEIAHKYGGEIPMQFSWGYALAWHENGKIRVESVLTENDIKRAKIVDEISPKGVPGFFMSSVLKVFVNGEWKFDAEITEEENWEAYWNDQAIGIKKLLDIYEEKREA